MRVDLEQKIPVESSSRDEGSLFGNKKFPWGRHHVMRVDLEQNFPVHSTSRDEGLQGKSVEACPTVNLVSPTQL
jgi:hypothetical protein